MKKNCFRLSISFKIYFFLFFSLLYGKVLEKDFKMNNIFLIFQLFIYTWFPIEYVILFFGKKFFLLLNPHFIYLTNRNVELWKVVLLQLHDRVRFKRRFKLTTALGKRRRGSNHDQLFKWFDRKRGKLVKLGWRSTFNPKF